MADKELELKLKASGGPQAAKEVAKVEVSVEDLQKQSRQTKEALIDLADAIDATGDESPQTAKELREVAATLDDLEEKALAADAAQKKLAATGPGVAKSQRNSGLAVLEFSRAIEDAQYGIRGVLNNIPQLIAYMGGGAGLAGVVSLAAVAAAQLIPLLGKMGDASEAEAKKLEDAQGKAEAAVEAVNRRLEQQRQARADAEASSLLDLGAAAIKRWKDEEAALGRVIAQYRAFQAVKLEEISAAAGIETARVNADEAAGRIDAIEAIRRRAIITDKAEADALVERQKAAEMEITVNAERVRIAEAQLADLKKQEANAARQSAEADAVLGAGQGTGAAFNAAREAADAARAALERAQGNVPLAKVSGDLEAYAAAQSTFAKATVEAAEAIDAETKAREALDQYENDKGLLAGNAAEARKLAETARSQREEAEALLETTRLQVEQEEKLIRLRQQSDAFTVSSRAATRGIEAGSRIDRMETQSSLETRIAELENREKELQDQISKMAPGFSDRADQIKARGFEDAAKLLDSQARGLVDGLSLGESEKILYDTSEFIKTVPPTIRGLMVDAFKPMAAAVTGAREELAKLKAEMDTLKSQMSNLR